MPINLPPLQPAHLQSFRICACAPLDSTSLRPLVEQLGSEYERETRYRSHKGMAWIKARFATREKNKAKSREVQWQVDCALESAFPASRRHRKSPNSREEVCEFLTTFAGQRANAACCEGVFLVPQDQLSDRGLVKLMLDISFKVDKAQMKLTGAQLDIDGSSPYDRVRWRLTRGTGHKDMIEVVILARPDIGKIGDPEDVAQILSAGIQELIIEGGKQGE